jgi:hypothetical protein
MCPLEQFQHITITLDSIGSQRMLAAAQYQIINTTLHLRGSKRMVAPAQFQNDHNDLAFERFRNYVSFARLSSTVKHYCRITELRNKCSS